eukprot:SAG25_NODE_486_length_7469_cov_4.137449_5_plen_162_part_00
MTVDTRQSDNPNASNPASSRGAPLGAGTSMIQLAMGGLTPRHGFPLHCRLRYFDAVRRRAGMPPGVAALVTAMSVNATTVIVVNTNQTSEARLVVQGGAYGEHKIVAVSGGASPAPIQPLQTTAVDSPCFRLRLAPGAGTTLVLTMERWAFDPSFAFPWDR